MESNVTIQQPTFEMTAVGQMIKQFETTQRIGKMYADATIIPETYKGNVANCSIATEMAIRMNLNPIAVMQNLSIVQGKPSWASKFLIACVNTCGKYAPLRYEEKTDGMIGKVEYTEYVYDPNARRNVGVTKVFDGTKLPNLSCMAWTIEKETGERLDGITIDLRMAIREGWYLKNGSKWSTMPILMLRYRAASMWVNTNDPALSMGFMTQEEVNDVTWEDAQVVETKKTTKGDRLKTVAALAQEAASTKAPSPTPEAQPVAVKVEAHPSQNEDLFAEPVK